jgi:hypothetical protein
MEKGMEYKKKWKRVRMEKGCKKKIGKGMNPQKRMALS